LDNENKVNVNETCGIFINDVIMEETYDENPIVQKKKNRNLKGENEQLMENDIKKLHVQKKAWKPHGRTSLCVLMIIQMLILKFHKLCVVYFVLIV